MAAMAAAGLSCGGGPQTDSVAGVNAVSPAASEEAAATVTASAKTGRVLVCHNGKDKSVSPVALADHEAHGDRLGSCSDPDVAICPCFTQSDIADAKATCPSGSQVLACAAEPAEYSFLYLTCPEGAPGNIGQFETKSSAGFVCSGTWKVPVPGSPPGVIVVSERTISEAEFQVCRGLITLQCPAS